MRSWKISPQLRYDVGVEVSPASDHMLQDVLHGLSKAMAATENDAGTYLVVPNDPARQDKLALMLLLEQKRVVEQSGEDEWSLSELGQKRFSVRHRLEMQGMALAIDTELSSREAPVFALLQRLNDAGWTPQLYVRRKRGERAPAAYQDGCDKVFWATPKQKQWSADYLRALLSVAVHGRAVEHFRANPYYAAILNGREYKPRGHAKKATAFSFVSADAPVAEPKWGAVPEEWDSSGSEVSDKPLRAGNALGSEDDLFEELFGSPARSSSTSSSPSSATPVPDAMDDAAAGACDGPIADAAAVEEQPSLLADLTQDWRGFKFCQTYAGGGFGGEPQGWEATCYWSEHKASTSCRRTLSFAANGGRVRVEKLLKWWCLQSANCQTRENHRDLAFPTDDALPPLSTLDSEVFPPPGASGFVRSVRRRLA